MNRASTFALADTDKMAFRIAVCSALLSPIGVRASATISCHIELNDTQLDMGGNLLAAPE